MSRSQDTSIRLRVLIIDPHEVSRAAVRALLQTEGLDVVADVSSGELAFALGDVYLDVAVIDISRGTPEAFKLADALTRLRSMPTVVLTSSTAPDAALNGHTFIAKPELCARRLRLAMPPHEHDS